MKIAPLAMGALGGTAAALMLVPAARDSLDRLHAARQARDEVEVQRTQPQLPGIVVPALATAAGSRERAGAILAARVRQAAARAGVLVEQAEPVARADGLAGLKLRLSGGEASVIALADALERGQPIARFDGWRIEGQGASVRLTGQLVAPWR